MEVQTWYSKAIQASATDLSQDGAGVRVTVATTTATSACSSSELDRKVLCPKFALIEC
jgi:hypothetical protein